MKLLLLLLLSSCFAMLAVHAQSPKIDIKKFKQDPSYREALVNHFETKKIVLEGIITPIQLPVFRLNVKPGVYRLLNDNMPCIVPDTKDIAAIPNAFEGKVSVPFVGNQPRIPNAIQPKVFELLGKK